MKKYLIGLLLVLLLTACGTSQPASTEEPESEPISSTEETTSETANLEADNDEAAETDNGEEVAAVAEEESEESEESEEDTAVTAVDGPTYEPSTTIPEAAELKATDHSKGAEDPIIAIIEYGDFQ